MNEMNEIELDGLSVSKKEQVNLLESSIMDDYHPIQKNSRLFKFILYASKVEIKSNSLMKMIYSSSLFEIALWAVCLLLFISAPDCLYLIWVLIIHVVKGILGLQILNRMPKTYEIIENLAKNPNFEEDKIIDLIQAQIRETFIDRWTQNKNKLLWYLIANIICLIIDLVIFAIQIIIFGNKTNFLMQTVLLFIIIIFMSKF